MITIVTLINSFFLSFKKCINFVGFITPAVERWLIQLKSLVAAPPLLVPHVYKNNRTLAQFEMGKKSSGD